MTQPATRSPKARSASTPSRGSGLRAVFGTLKDAPGLDYLMLRIVIFTLVGIGVLMAFSASMASSWVASGYTSVWSLAIRQTAMVVLGLVLFWVALKTPPRVVRRFTGIFLVIAFISLVLVLTPLGTGRESVGSQSWIYIGSVSIQPSEIARVAIGLYGANLLADRTFKRKPLLPLSNWLRDPFVLFTLVGLLFFTLIIIQGDAGMAMSFALVVAFVLFFAGMDWRMFAAAGVFAVLGLVGVFAGGGYRTNRFHTYFDALVGNIEDTQGTGFQTYQGFLSLADGGAMGVGLGQSRAKWFYLPEARNDFVFAIVGEEIGLWGGLLVVALFGLLGVFGIRTAMRAQDQFQALAAGTLTLGVVSQALFNISYVIGLLPVTGIQLPMISSGGSATIITIGSMGLLCSFARHEPEQVSAMQNFGRPAFDRMLGIQEPEPAGRVPAPGGKRRKGRHGAGEQERADAPRRTGAQDARARYGAPVTGRGRNPRRGGAPVDEAPEGHAPLRGGSASFGGPRADGRARGTAGRGDNFRNISHRRHGRR